MADSIVTAHGQALLAGDDRALFLKEFSGEVLSAFNVMNKFGPLHRVRSIMNGKSAQFPVLGTVTASYHTPGTELVGQATSQNERVLVIDDMLVADVFVAEIDELISHYDVRAEYSKQIGETLAKTWDQNVARLIVLAARASAINTGFDGGTTLTNANYADTGATIAAGLFSAAQALDEKNVGEDERYAFFRPAQYYILAQTTNVLNRDWGGSGAYSEGSVLKVAGIHIDKSNNVPSTNVTTGPSQYRGDFSTVQGIVFQKSAVGTVKLREPTTVVHEQPEKIGTLVYGKMAVGSDYLRPECAVELKSS